MILEGSDRVGGRINTVKTKTLKGSMNNVPVMVDGGAQWLHGRSNELFKVAEGSNLIHSELSQEAEGDFIREDGLKLDEYLVKKVDFKFGQILEECEKFVQLKTDKKNLTFPSSIEEFVNEKFKEFVDSLTLSEEKQHARQLLDWHRKFVSFKNDHG